MKKQNLALYIALLVMGLAALALFFWLMPDGLAGISLFLVGLYLTAGGVIKLCKSSPKWQDAFVCILDVFFFLP